MKSKGVGRTLVAAYLRKKFPRFYVRSISIEDSFTDKKKFFDDFSAGRTDILLSDASFSAVANWTACGLFAILNADYFLYGGGWRAEEKTFLWLRKVETFLREVSPGALLFVQTRGAAKLCVQAFSEGDDFYEEQLKERKKFNFPPFARLIRLRIDGKKAEEACETVFAAMKPVADEISPPAEISAFPGGRKVFEIVLKIKPDKNPVIPEVKGAKITAGEEM